MRFLKQIDMQKTDFGFQFDYDVNNKKYSVQVVYPSRDDNYSIPYVLVIPNEMKENSLLAVEVNNLEKDNEDDLLDNALLTAYNLTNKLKEYDNPVLIPILPSVSGGVPYYQQLLKECFDVSSDNNFYRIDLQVLNIIRDAKEKLSKKVEINEKVFLNGYSSSGVFAQRFALLHPDIVDTLCVGGASGSIPIPITELEYPLGILDFEKITGKPFDLDAYSQIKFRYYVGSLEDSRKTFERYDENGDYAPMHDMSYFDRSVPHLIGEKQRNMFGRDMIKRAQNQILLMNEMGLDIKQTVFLGRTHNNYNGIGVNELGDEFVNNSYKEFLEVKE